MGSLCSDLSLLLELSNFIGIPELLAFLTCDLWSQAAAPPLSQSFLSTTGQLWGFKRLIRTSVVSTGLQTRE